VTFDVYRDRVRFPAVSETLLTARRVTVPLASVRSVDVLPNGSLIVDTTSETYVLPPSSFANPSSIPRLRDTVAAQMRLLPGGAEVLARAELDAAALRELLRRPARVTMIALGLCVVAFVVELFVGHGDHALFRLGANVRSLTWHGDWHRLFTAGFLHVGFWHLLFNVSFISVFGGLVERAIGPARFLVVYLLSGVMGSSLSSVFDFMSVGASTSAFGLVGALGLMQYRYANALPAASRMRATQWFVLVGLNAALPFMFPNISWSGHVGGLVGGVLACALVAPTPEALAGHDAPGGVRAAAALLVAAQLCSFAVGADYARSDTDFEAAFRAALASDRAANPR
jgi:rhomboid protease GluP